MTGLDVLMPMLLAAGVPLLVAAVLGTEKPLARALILLPPFAFLARYMHWRWTTPLPEGEWLQTAWSNGFLTLETLGLVSAVSMMAVLLRETNRSPEAAAVVPPALRDAPVDVFICTHTEGREILERTILCATRIAHRDLRVWVLDDGARAWVRDLAAELGVRYERRVKGTHAKAGNVNNGLMHALATGRRPDYVLLLDADFAAHRQILRRTLPLFATADVGIVQTPQHFYNPDPVQSGFLASHAWPDEQRFFFNNLMPGKDGWGAAFCCGTSAVFRVRALLEAGGMATETVTEDMLTSFKMAEHGWRTVYLNERLSAGLAPKGLAEYVTQRSRWCLGAIQQLFTRWSFFGSARMSLANRLAQLDTSLYWIASFPCRLLVLAAPAMFWWFGVNTFAASNAELLSMLAPALVGSILAMGLVSNWRRTPVLSDTTQLLVTFPIIASVAQALLRPFGRPFKVTPRGISRGGITLHWALMSPFLALALATAGGMAMHISDWSPARDHAGVSLNMVWSLLTLAVLALVIACCIELPRPRHEERFATNEPAQVLLDGGGWHAGRLRDLSTRGTFVAVRDMPTHGTLERGVLLLDGGSFSVPFTVVRHAREGLALRFADDTDVRRRLILRLYTGEYRNEVEDVALIPAVHASLKRLIS
jgi:cellulose synthase (UDP-forming)